MSETTMVYAQSPGKSEPLPPPIYAESAGAGSLRKLRLAMIVERAGRK